jgi:hypothetical protein
MDAIAHSRAVEAGLLKISVNNSVRWACEARSRENRGSTDTGGFHHTFISVEDKLALKYKQGFVSGEYTHKQYMEFYSASNEDLEYRLKLKNASIRKIEMEQELKLTPTENT